ncbi:GNAT family N-acetyltransferase [Aspergillus homomorphus CBS 101889]|uniref:Acyl-CoA N-acyltransferase n=1 Tax=Aspergillus homomorphus (strain CBS 101889) TaxID=1450537 RepID=A0A395HTJ5_ASPHC|nr:acyl-CoA N-acyltransferase [Aspergillus homomorphus CBS 101889]RAL10733.1 acyl-CoA N-acyltransferase [Aspergillus homomorphus CBS 101889]
MASTDTHIASLPALAGLSAFTRPLTIADLDSCVTVESAFPEQERCSREKFIYRLTKCPKLSLGLFIQPNPSSIPQLIAHVIAIRTTAPCITDGSMRMPPTTSWPAMAPHEVAIDPNTKEPIGHEPAGSNLAVHSLAVVPEYQGGGVGRALMSEYIQWVRSEDIADAERVVLIAHEYLVPFYERMGFRCLGASPSQFAGGGWFDMVC